MAEYDDALCAGINFAELRVVVEVDNERRGNDWRDGTRQGCNARRGRERGGLHKVTDFIIGVIVRDDLCERSNTAFLPLPLIRHIDRTRQPHDTIYVVAVVAAEVLLKLYIVAFQILGDGKV